MKPGLAILPLEVWADVSEHPLITRQLMAQIADNNGDPEFTNKLQKLLHGCGKHSLRFLDISAKKPDKPMNKVADNVGGRGFINKFQKFLRGCGKQTRQCLGISLKQDKPTQEPEIPEWSAVLTVSPNGGGVTTYKECEFPETGMPENTKTFKALRIRHLDDEVLGFLEKIKPLFTNVLLDLGMLSIEQAENPQILFGHLLPMLGCIRGIKCDNYCLYFLEQHFPGSLAMAKELKLIYPELATSIPTYLNWLCAPQDFGVDGPRLLTFKAESETIFAIIDAVREQFMAATTSSAFVIFLEFYHHERHLRANKLTIENTTTKEQLTVRNAIFKNSNGNIIHYAKVLRHPIGAHAKMREWIKQWADYEKMYNYEANKEILIYNPTIG